MKNYRFNILLSLIACVLCIIFDDFIQNIIALVGIFSFGILHGSNDLQIISSFNFKNKNSSNLNYFILYLLVVLIGALFFFYIPFLALFFFIIVSCYHFGEQHWNSKLTNGSFQNLFYFLYGGLIFFLLFIIKHDDVSDVVFKITSLEIELFYYQIIFFSFLFSTIFTIILKRDFSILIIEFFLLSLFSVVFYYSTLIYGFAFYFVIWHSIPSFKSQLTNLYGNISFVSILKYLKSSLIYWLLSLFLLIGSYFYLDIEADYILPLFFSFLAAITFPHVIVITYMFHSNKIKLE